MSPKAKKAMKTNKINIIDFVTKKLNITQADIAERLDVSAAQVSKWKKGEEIPFERRKTLNEMAGLFGDNFEWCLLTKTPENANAWIHFFSEYHDCCIDVDPCHLLSDEPDVYVPPILLLFEKIGIKIPEKAPSLFDDNEEEDEVEEECDNDFNSFVCKYLESYAALINYNSENIGELGEDDDDIFDRVMGIEYCIRDFALDNIDDECLEKVGADFSKIAEVIQEARKNISIMIKDIIRIQLSNNRPIMRDYFELLKDGPYDLDDGIMFKSLRGLSVDSSVDTLLPYFQKTVLEHVKLQTELLSELHVKLDTLLKHEDKVKLSKELKYTSPFDNIHLNKETGESDNTEESDNKDGSDGSE